MQTIGQRTAIAYDRRKIANMEAEISVLQDRQRQLNAIMESVVYGSDAWHDAAQEYDNLGDAIGKLQNEITSTEDTMGMP